MRIVFMGTPEFAVYSLRRILNSSHEVVGIVTVPDKPRGRGKRVQPSPVKQFALEHNLKPILQPESLKDGGFLEELKKLNADLFVVVAFRILPEEVFSIPSLGTINLHASLLPAYRGAAPINWVIMNGEKETGVTTFIIEKGVDTGKILLQEKVMILDDETAGSLHDRLAKVGAELLVRTLDLLAKKEIVPEEQPFGEFPKAPKITKEILKIDWNKNAQEIKQHVHGLSPYPGAYSLFRGKKVKILRAKVVNDHDMSIENFSPGEVVKVTKNNLFVKCKDNSLLSILELQFEGKRKMTVEEAIRGYRFKEGEKFI